uniref:ubiquitinyl hydrolase 1 n=1 Tax=Gouania willdenowi TaxID=441366 RepID=A0A8C5G324_GOUWI
MSAPQEPHRKRRPPKMYLVSADRKVQDQHEASIMVQRGFLCQEQDSVRKLGDHAWVKMLDNGVIVRIERKCLLELSTEQAGLLEPVSEPEARLRLMVNPRRLQQLSVLPIGSPLWVQLPVGQPDELLEAELKYIGVLTRGSNAVYFGVQLKGSAVGRGIGNGSFKGHLFFSCPEDCALFLPASHIRPRQWSSTNGSDPHERPRGNHRNHNAANGHHVRGHVPSQPFQVKQRVCFQKEDAVHAGEVCFCGLLPGRSSSGVYVGIVADSPVGDWDGVYKGERLCYVPSSNYGLLLPASSVTAGETHTHTRVNPPLQLSKSILKPALLSFSKPPPTLPTGSTPKAALIPPNKAPLKLPPLPPPKPSHKPLSPPPVPLPKPHSPSPSSSPQAADSAPSSLFSPLTDDAEDEDVFEEAGAELEVGSMVEVNKPPLYGVIRWIGQINGVIDTVAGIELDQELSAGTDGSYLGERHFRCPPNKGLFVKLRNCRRDSRFPAPETPVNQVDRCNSVAFADWGSERVEDHTPPVDGAEAKEIYEGWKKGIQGHLNSCYLDATLFSLFSCCSSADWLLYWPFDPKSHQSSAEAQDLLRCEIVNPLRRFGYVCASKTMALRRLLEAANINAGFTNQEKDPEEFLNKLFQLLRVEPLLKIRSMTQQPQECHLYQLFPPSLPPSSASVLPPVGSPIPLSSPSAGRMRVASVQSLLESSFFHARLKLVEAPSCLLLLMPRFGKDFKMFEAILPSLSLDITDLLDNSLRQCSICQAVAQWECLQCYDDTDITPGHLKQYCSTCNTQVHSHRKRASHTPLKIVVPAESWSGSLHANRQLMSLFAVTCIETSHYVSFVKHGPLQTDWMFFDSMADREGGENGFNVPQVKACPEVGRFLGLSEEELSRVDSASLGETSRRLLCDAYMCLYHSPELSLYK